MQGPVVEDSELELVEDMVYARAKGESYVQLICG